MFVKIVRYLDEEHLVTGNDGTLNVIPKEQTLYEVSDSVGGDDTVIPAVRYSKHTVKSLNEFYKMLSDRVETESYNVVGSVIDDKENLLGEEFLVLQFTHKNKLNSNYVRTVVTRDCQLYILNKDGKTIDSLQCR